MTVLLQNRACKCAPPTTNTRLSYCLSLFTSANEVAVSTHNGKGVDVIVGESIARASRASLVSAQLLLPRGEESALHYLYGVLGEGARG